MADLRSSMTFRRLYALPSESYREMPSSCSAAFAFFELDILFRKARRPVPAFCALMPALAMRPEARARSSMEKPRLPAILATYLKVMPSFVRSVLLDVAAAVSTSARCAASPLPSCRLVSVSATMLAASCRLPLPATSARRIRGPMAFSISPLFQPAMARLSMAWAASLALRLVISPMRRAVSRRLSSDLRASSALMPRPSRFMTAPTLDIWASKAEPVCVISRAARKRGRVTSAVSPSPDRAEAREEKCERSP